MLSNLEPPKALDDYSLLLQEATILYFGSEASVMYGNLFKKLTPGDVVRVTTAMLYLLFIKAGFIRADVGLFDCLLDPEVNKIKKSTHDEFYRDKK
jgi:hypothetical protein